MLRIMPKSPPRERTKIGNNHIGPCIRKWANSEKHRKRTNARFCSSSRQSPRAARKPTAPFWGREKAITAASKTKDAVSGNIKPNVGWETFVPTAARSAMRQRSQRPGQHKHKDKITARAPSSHPAERVAPGVAQNRQTHRHHQWKYRRADDRERGCRDHDRPETVRVAKPEVAQRRAQGEKRQHARARPGAIRHLAPERLRDHADQRRDRQDKSDLCPRQPGVLTQIECKVGIKDPERTKIGEPKQRQRDRMPHRPMIAFIVAVYDGGSKCSRCSNRRIPNYIWNLWNPWNDWNARKVSPHDGHRWPIASRPPHLNRKLFSLKTFNNLQRKLRDSIVPRIGDQHGLGNLDNRRKNSRARHR